MLLSLVNDMLDMKLIQHNQFCVRKEPFSPLEVLKFVTAMFKIEEKFVKTQISYNTVKAEHLDKVFEMHDRH